MYHDTIHIKFKYYKLGDVDFDYSFLISKNNQSKFSAINYGILLEKFNEIAEKRPIHEEIGRRRELGKYEGAFVFQPTPGIYKDLAAFDFTSMHGSVINSFNLSLANYLGNKSVKNSQEIEVEYAGESKFYFSKKPTFFPILMGELIERRKQLKKQILYLG